MLGAAALALAARTAAGQEPSLFDPDAALPGWSGFADLRSMGGLLLSLILATVLSASLAYHPRSYSKLDSPAQLETPKTFVVYAVVGAVVGTLVLQYGPVVGLVVFGLGGLTRFRTILESPAKTGKAILVTLIGLLCGLNLPHVAVVTTVFAFGLIWLLEHDEVYRIVVGGLDAERLPAAADAYREALLQSGCDILTERKSFAKLQLTLVFRAASRGSRGALERLFRERVPAPLRGSVDWKRG